MTKAPVGSKAKAATDMVVLAVKPSKTMAVLLSKPTERVALLFHQHGSVIDILCTVFEKLKAK